MADNDRTRGYRDNEAYRRPKPSTGQAGDPLAELARLIGQQNQFAPTDPQNGAPYGRQPDPEQAWSAPDPYAQQDGSRQAGGVPHWPSSHPDETSAPASAYGSGQYDPRYDAPQADHNAYPASYGDPRQTAAPYADGQYAEGQYAEGQYADPRYSDQQYAPDPRYHDPRHAAGHVDPRYTDPRYADPRYAEQHYDDGAGQGYADPRYADPNFGTQQYGAESYAPGSDGYRQVSADPRYAGHGYQDGGQAYGNSPYGVPPLPRAMPGDYAPAKRRGSMVTVLAVLALAVVGTASAFGYRAMFGGTGSPVPAPIIQADPRPSKIVPATDASNKPIQDRIGVKTEKIVPRQEEPVQQAAPGQPRVIAPFLAGQNPQAFPPASANIAPGGPGAGAPSGTAEPKRVRTVPIKPQGAEAPGPRSSRSVAPADETNVADAGGSPLALAPTGSIPPSQRQAARQAHAAIPTNEASAARSPFPTPAPAGTGASASRAPASGPFAVQVTSQRSEADAQASFRSLQQQFPSVLGSRQPVIRRADLGERGTYYRAQIPFSSQNEASEFCTNLKSAGGQCVVARN